MPYVVLSNRSCKDGFFKVMTTLDFTVYSTAFIGSREDCQILIDAFMKVRYKFVDECTDPMFKVGQRVQSNNYRDFGRITRIERGVLFVKWDDEPMEGSMVESLAEAYITLIQGQ